MRASARSSTCSSAARRSITVCEIVQFSRYWPQKLNTPRSANSPISTIGTIQIGKLYCTWIEGIDRPPGSVDEAAAALPLKPSPSA